MEAMFRAANPDDIEFTLTMTKSLREWKAILETLSKENRLPEVSLGNEIRSMVSQAEQRFWPKDTEK